MVITKHPERSERIERDETRVYQEQLLQGVLRAMVIAGGLAIIAGSYDSYTNGEYWTLPFYWVSYGLTLLLTFWRRIPYGLRALALPGLLYILGVVDFVQEGLAGSGRVFLMGSTFAASVFLGRRAGVVSLVLSTLTLVGFGLAFSSGWLTVAEAVGMGDIVAWLVAAFTLTMLNTLIVVSLNYLVPRLAAALGQSRQLAREVEAERAGLEEQVVARTADLARRKTELETAAEVARDAGTIQDVEQLLAETARLISERFQFYHTGIFLLDEAREYAVLRAASSEGGRRMMARQHRLRAGDAPVGIVGDVAARGDPHIALDVGGDAVFFDNPDLPETRSEMALPLRARGEIIGVLDVQSTEPEAFDEEDVAVLQTLADQVAIAISNARLVQQAQASLEAERRAYGEMSIDAWRELTSLRAGVGRRYDPQGVLSSSAGDRREGVELLAVPLKVRGQVIGTLDAYKPADGGEWTAEETGMLEALADQLGVALDSARLYQETQRRAAQEQLMARVTTRMRETMDVDTVLQTAVREIGESLGLYDLAIRLEVGSEQTV
jgi:GAF domain-containing protein